MIRLLTAVLACTVLSGVQAANACGTNCWGAVGIGQNGAAGYSYNYATENDALDRLFYECPACTDWYTFVNACGAMARAPDGAWGSGWGDTRDLAEYYAAQSCSKHTRSGGCQTVVWACNGG